MRLSRRTSVAPQRLSSVPKAERAQALMFLAHFVGDLHQPLHTGYQEDRRGSLLPATVLHRVATDLLRLLAPVWCTISTPGT